MHVVLGTKTSQTQKFLVDGTRIPVTIVTTPGNPVVMIKTREKDGYWALQLGLGDRKNANKPQYGHAKKAHLQKAPSFLAEVRLSDKETENLPSLGDILVANTILTEGDIVDVTGVSKGKGFAGGVKRYGFHGGPKSHGQSDRWRAPGSIGSGTTPGRVYRGKRMAGKMGNDTTTLKNLEVVKVGDGFIWVKGVVPGTLGASIIVKATGKKNKKFVETMKTEDERKAEEVKMAEEKALADAQALKAAEESAKIEEATKTEVPLQEEVQSESKEKEDASVEQKGEAK